MTKRNLFFAQILIVSLLMGLVGCKRHVRHYHDASKMKYARVAVDTAAHDDFDNSEVDEWQEEPIFQDEPSEKSVKDRKKARDEYNKFIRGEHME